jgi:hypothetical protein
MAKGRIRVHKKKVSRSSRCLATLSIILFYFLHLSNAISSGYHSNAQ